MGSLLDFTEAIKDSPSFRHEISLNERHFDKAHKRLDEALRLVELVVDHGQNYVASFYNLTASLNGLWTDMDVDEPTAQDTHKLMSDALAQLVHLNKSLVESAYPALRIGLEFLRNDLSKLNETRSQFDSLSSSLSDALAKKASINKNKTQELQDARNSLTAVGTCFAHNSLDYVALMNIAHARKSHVVLESLWAFVKESASYFHKGDTFFNEKPYCQTDDITDAIDLLKNRVKAVERKMQDRHSVVPREVFQHPAGLPTTDPHVVMEGYLFKRATNAFKTWNRRWFMIKEDKLLYSHKSSDGSSMPTIMEENLKLCLVRPAPTSVERACCFELVTPSKNHLLQADSESLCNAWIRALQRTIQHLHEDDQGYRNTSRMSFISNFEAASARSTNQSSPPNGISVTHRGLASASTMPANVRCQSSSSQAHPDAGSNSDVKSNGSVSSHTTTKSRASSNAAETMQFVRQLCSTPGNERCADCGHTDAKWASINLGVIICIECSGAHRSLGVHRSKVRSLTMDSLEPEQRNILLQLGNKKVNSIFLACVPTDSEVVSPEQLTPHSSREAREAWIIAKYVDKKFSRPDAQRHLNSSLKTHARSTSMNDMATYGITHYNAYFSPSPQTSIDKETPSSSKESKFGAANDPKIEITNAMEPGSLGI
ncbi:BAR domain of APPL family domain-containing protein [Ditylenchus destructor]|uniref:BAR domain of APPL family domain-containing protein n=1 Tax=Ditylenchus destructor TaxID=166010 RepID=A0AAD4N133_9BILA|nr:BAR domain of APPL family domain-containing protein [Ditylenchus destructor]